MNTQDSSPSLSQHTSGPWAVQRLSPSAKTWRLLGGQGQLALFSFENLPKAQEEANAKLLAASPDMLSASVSALALLARIDALCIDGKVPCLGAIRELARDAAGPMRSAIAKAKGGAA
jgi:hypothetical protein